jgi:putative membrane protein
VIGTVDGVATTGLGRLGALRVAAGSALVMALTQIAVPLTDDRATLTTVVVVAFAVTTTALVAAVWGWRRALLACAVVVVATTALERIGTTTGLPFGQYRYTGELRPTIAGVPLAVVLAWFAMAVPAREVAARLVRTGWQRVLVGAVALTAWDLMLDPQMVGEGYWVWEGGGPWRDVPLSNYAGWLVSASGVMVLLELLLPAPGRSRLLLGLYTWWAVMQTLGFLVFFGDPLVGVVGGAVMLPPTWLAWRATRTTAEGRARVAPLEASRRG